MKRNKKADFSIQTIIIIVLCLVVLFVLILIFRNQIGSTAAKILGVEQNVTGGKETEDLNNYLFPHKETQNTNTENNPKDTANAQPK